MVEAEPVDGRTDAFDIARPHVWLDCRLHELRIDAQTLRVGKRPVPIGIATLGRLPIVRRRWQARLKIVNGANRAIGHARTQDLDRRSVREIDVVDGAVQRLDAGCRALAAKSEPEHGEDGRLVERREALDPIAIARRHQRRVVGKPAGTVPDRPAAEIVERLRKIPMIEAQPWFDARGENCIDEPIVERQARLIRRTPAQRNKRGHATENR